MVCFHINISFFIGIYPILLFSGNRSNGWELHTCGDLLDADFCRMLSPTVHFPGSKDVFNGPIHTGAAELGVLSRSKTALAYINANIRVMIEVSGHKGVDL